MAYGSDFADMMHIVEWDLKDKKRFGNLCNGCNFIVHANDYYDDYGKGSNQSHLMNKSHRAILVGAIHVNAKRVIFLERMVDLIRGKTYIDSGVYPEEPQDILVLGHSVHLNNVNLRFDEEEEELNLTTWGHAAFRVRMIESIKKLMKEKDLGIEIVTLLPGVVLGPLLIKQGSSGFASWNEMYDEFDIS